jgi:hypothetical protein
MIAALGLVARCEGTISRTRCSTTYIPTYLYTVSEGDLTMMGTDLIVETESSNRDGNEPLHDDQWTLVQNTRRTWRKGNGVIKDGLV